MKRYAFASWGLVAGIILMVAAAAVLDGASVGKPVPVRIEYSTAGPCPSGVCPVPRLPENVTPPAAVVRVEGQEQGGGSFGTGTIIATDGQTAQVLTAWHILRGGGAPYVHVAGQRLAARVVLCDRTWDVAVWEIADPGVTPLPLASRMPGHSERLVLCGYGSGQYAAQRASVTGAMAPGQGEPNDMLECSGQARQGDSGGPICDGSGHVVGVISAAGRGFTIGCGVRRINILLEACRRRRGAPHPAMPRCPSPPCGPVIPCDPVTPAPLPAPPAPAPAPNGRDADQPAGTPAVPAALVRDVADLKRAVADLRAVLNVAAGRPGPAGPQGPAGPMGPMPSGSITIQTIDFDGTVLQSAEAHLGETIQLQLIPVTRK